MQAYCRTTRRIRRKVSVVYYMSFRHRWIAARLIGFSERIPVHGPPTARIRSLQTMRGHSHAFRFIISRVAHELAPHGRCSGLPTAVRLIVEEPFGRIAT